MTGLYVRVEREGRWCAVSFDRLTDAEMDAFIAECRENTPPEAFAAEGWRWTKALAKWIRDNVKGEEYPP